MRIFNVKIRGDNVVRRTCSYAIDKGLKPHLKTVFHWHILLPTIWEDPTRSFRPRKTACHCSSSSRELALESSIQGPITLQCDASWAVTEAHLKHSFHSSAPRSETQSDTILGLHFDNFKEEEFFYTHFTTSNHPLRLSMAPPSKKRRASDVEDSDDAGPASKPAASVKKSKISSGSAAADGKDDEGNPYWEVR